MDIVKDYEHLGSLRAVAAKNDISESKVKKKLISHGAYHTELGDKIEKLHKKGRTIKEIAEILNISEKTVNVYLPYQKGEYKSDNPTENAIRIRKCRNKNKESE